MDLEAIKHRWHEDAQSLPPRLEEGPVVLMVTEKEAELRGRVRRRLRREAGYYLPMMAFVTASLLSGFTTNRLLAAISVALSLGAVMATLWRAQHRIEDVALDRSVREALLDLGSTVQAARRAYLAVYVALFAASAAALVGFVWWRQGFGLPLAGAGAGGVVAVVWSLQSGRAYVERMFRGYELELAEYLRQLQEPV